MTLRYNPDPVELRPCLERSSRFVISKVIREWKNSKKKTVSGSLSHISEDGQKVFLTLQFGKYISIGLDLLSESDKTYVQKIVEQEKAQGKSWFLGVYMDDKRIRQIMYENKALELIKSKDQIAQSFNGIKIEDAKKSGGYGKAAVQYSGDWYPQPDYTKDIFYMSSLKGIVTDGEIVGPRRFYWAGAFDYTVTRYWRNYWGEGQSYSTGKTTDCFTDDLKVAIRLVRETCKLYDKDDDEFLNDAKPSTSSLPASSAEELYATGSGFLVTSNGYVVTNYHVIENAKRIEIVNFRNQKYDAEIVLSDKKTDLALLKVAGTHMPIPFSGLRLPTVGTDVFTMGFPMPRLQGYQPKITKGVISGNEGFKGDPSRFQIDAAVQPGNSGGPLMDCGGRIVGVVVSSLDGGQNVNYAVKRSYLKSFIEANGDCYAELLTDTSKVTASLDEVCSRVRPGCVLINHYR